MPIFVATSLAQRNGGPGAAARGGGHVAIAATAQRYFVQAKYVGDATGGAALAANQGQCRLLQHGRFSAAPAPVSRHGATGAWLHSLGLAHPSAVG